MKDISITEFGIYDSKAVYKSQKLSPKRAVKLFELELLISCDGDATSFIDGKAYPLSPGTVILRKPGQECQSKLHFKAYYIHFSLSASSALYDRLYALPCCYSLINYSTYQPLFEQFIRHNLKKPENSNDLFSYSKLLELIYHIEKDAQRNERPSKSERTKENRAIERAVEFMKENYFSRITLSDLGRLTGYTPNHFQALFSRVMEKSPQKYLEDLRLNHAKFLLAKNEDNIAEVAYSCGFSSQAYFSTLFKRTTSLTPKEYREAVISKIII